MISDVIAGRYHVLGKVGQGGAAEVFKAMDTRLGRVVAIKLLRDTYSQDPTFTQRFENEARAAARLSHPNIVDVYDYDESDGNYFIAMEYVSGPNLKTYIEERGPLDEEVTKRLVGQVLDGLAAAHEAGLVHRDMKPQNVLIAPGNQLKIADFGIAKAMGDAGMTEAGIAFGTPHYLSPEQARGDGVTPATDLYAVGVMLYEMLSGRLPFEGDNPMKVAYAHVVEKPAPLREVAPDASPGMAAVVERAMAKDPEDRYASAGEMWRALAALPASTRMPAASADPSRETTVGMPVVRVPARTPLNPRAVAVSGRPSVIAQRTAIVERRRGYGALLALLPIALVLVLAGSFLAGSSLLSSDGAAPQPSPSPAQPIVAVPTPTEAATAGPPTETVPAPLPTEPVTLPATGTPTVVVSPQRPGELEAVLLDDRGVRLRWPDSLDEAGYTLQRRVAGGEWAPIARLLPNQTTYSDYGLPPGQILEYRLRAFNSGGNSPWTMAQLSMPAPTATGEPTGAPPATRTPTTAPVATDTPPPSPTRTSTPIPTATRRPAPTASPRPRATKTPAPIPTDMPAPTDTPRPTPTDIPAPTPTDTSEPTATPVSTATNTPAPTPTDTPEPTPTDTPEPTPTDTPEPTSTPVPTDTPAPPAPTDTPVPTPTDTPEPRPTRTPRPGPTEAPTSAVPRLGPLPDQ